MIRKVLLSLEDPIRPFLGPNYWFLHKLGFILPKTKFGKRAYIFLHELVGLFVFTQYVELYLKRTDMDEVLMNLKISMLSVICVVKANTFVIWQDIWLKLLDYITEADKFERDHQNELAATIIDKYTRYSRRITHFYWALVFITFIVTTQAPLLMYVTNSQFREGLRNGTEAFPHIFSSWMPFDKNQWPFTWITVIWHVFMSAYGACNMAAYDSCVIVIFVFIKGKLELLREKCKAIFGSSDGEITETDEEISLKIRKLHEIHINLTRHAKIFKKLLAPVMFLYVIIGGVMLCASTFQLTSPQNAAQRLFTAEYLIFGLFQLFFFCWHSNEVFKMSETLRSGPFESKWWASRLRHRKDILLLTGQFSFPYIFKAGPFANLTVSTFVSVLKGSYSYYTLLRD